eukprot:6270164-Amphidinium_carterae.1
MQRCGWGARLEQDVYLHPTEAARQRPTHIADVVATSPNLSRVELDVRCLSSSGISPQTKLEAAEALKATTYRRPLPLMATLEQGA